MRVALPVIIGGFVQAFVVMVDNFFLSKVDTVAFNAAGYGSMFYISVYMLGMGYTNAVQVVIARRHGERDFKKVGLTYMQAVWFLLIFAALLWGLLTFFGNSALDQLMKDPEFRDGTKRFLGYRSWGIFFAFMNLTFVALYVGIQRTGPLAIATGVTAILNIILDYCLIFGNWGFPEMGLEGAALASSLSEASGTIYGVIYTWFFLGRRRYHLHRFIGIRWPEFKRMALLSIPLMIQSFMSIAAWAAFFLIIEKLGKASSTISHAIRNVYVVALIPLYGFSATTRTYVSGLIAQRRTNEVVPTVRRLVVLSVATTFLLIHGGWFYPSGILSIWLSDYPELIAEGRPVMFVATASLLTYAASGVLFSLVTGSGDTRTALFIEGSCIMLYLIAAYIFTLKLDYGLTTVWLTEFLYFGLLGLAAMYYIHKGKWKNIKV